MKNFLLLITCLAVFGRTSGQQATIREERVAMKTYMFSDPDPVPEMEKNYPYFRFDGYTNQGSMREWNMVIMENDYIQVFITPEIGGKIWGAVEKSTGGDFLYYNDVVKFRDVAFRGPWTSGGIEFNFGIMSHVSTCSTPQDYVLKTNPDGSVSCIIGALDLHTMTRWNVEVRLEKDKAYFETRASWFNTASLPVSFYHYMNAAAKTEGNLEFIFPGSHHIGHGGEVGTWPVEDGREISFYNNNDFGSYKSYHVLNAYSDFMGGYWHDDQFGFGHLGNYDEMPGKKLWIWGLADEGMIWEDLLTDTHGQYIEWQTGKSFNQAMEKSSLTPFKHAEFTPHDADITVETWFPLKNTRGMVAASRHGVLNVRRKGNTVELYFSALQNVNDELKVRVAGELISSQELDLKALELHTATLEIAQGEPFTVELGADKLYYSSDPEALLVNRPLEPNPEYDWGTAAGLYTLGLELERQQSYIEGGQVLRKALDYYLRSLEVDPAYVPSLNRVAASFLKRNAHETALDYVKKALAVDTYDAEANYLYGLINAGMGKTADAKSGFSIASQSPSHRTAAFTELSRLYMQEGRYGKADEYARKALAFNRFNKTAMEIFYLALKQQGEVQRSGAVLSGLKEMDPTSPFVKYYELVAQGSSLKALEQLVTNELAYETYLQLAVSLHGLGFSEDSYRILEAAPRHVIVKIWLAWLDEANREKHLQEALDMSPDFVFPHRLETLGILEELMEESDHWKLRYYAALVCWKKEMTEQAAELFLECGEQPSYMPFYLAKAEFFKDDAAVADAALEKAASLAPSNWRVNLALALKAMDDKQYGQAASLSKASLDSNPERSILGVTYADALLHDGQFKSCVSFLESYEIIPYEGATKGRSIFHEAALKAAMAAFEEGNYREAIAYAQKASLWPVNLGAGKPYFPDERMEDYICAISYEKRGMKSRAKQYYQKVMEHQTPGYRSENSLLYLQTEVLKQQGYPEQAGQLLKDLLESDQGNSCVAWVNDIAGLSRGAVSGQDGGSMPAPPEQCRQAPLLLELLTLIQNSQ